MVTLSIACTYMEEELIIYFESSIISIIRAMQLVVGSTLEFSKNLCKYLVDELSATEELSVPKFVSMSGSQDVVSENRRVTLVQLYFVIKKAKTLVQKCWRSQDLLCLKKHSFVGNQGRCLRYHSSPTMVDTDLGHCD